MSGYDRDSESALENDAVALFADMGYETANLYHRETEVDVVLRPRLLAALARLNPQLEQNDLHSAVAELARDRRAMNPVYANREVYNLLKNGVRITGKDDRGEEIVEIVRVIDWENPGNNDFFSGPTIVGSR